MPHALRKVKTRAAENLSARVYNQIKNLILSNEVMPGQKLHHQHLSERLGVSRTPVREALTRLVQEGYASFLLSRGFTCKEIRMQEAEELYDLREAIEAFAVEKATAHLTDAARGLAAHQEHLKLLEAMERRDVEEAVRVIRAHIQEGKSNTLSDLRQRQAIRDLRVAETID
jgi:DNA-binding GntR family transcriptional regulator